MFNTKIYKIKIFYFQPEYKSAGVDNLEANAKEFANAWGDKEETEKLFSYSRFLDLKNRVIELFNTDKEKGLKIVALLADHDGIAGRETGLTLSSSTQEIEQYLAKVEKLNYKPQNLKENVSNTPTAIPSKLPDQNEALAQKAELMRQITQQISFVRNEETGAREREHWLTDGITRLQGKKTTAETFKEYGDQLEDLYQKLLADKLSPEQARTEFKTLLSGELGKVVSATSTESGISGNIAFGLEQVKKLSETGFQIVLSKMLGDELGAFGAVLYNNTTDIIQNATAIAKEKGLNVFDPAVLKEATQKTYNEQFIENLQAPIQQWAIRKFGKALPPQMSRSLACGLTSAFAEVSGQVLDGSFAGKNPIDIMANIKMDQVFVSLLLGLGTGKIAGKVEGASANEVLKHLADGSLDGTQGVFEKLYQDFKEGRIDFSKPEYIKEIIAAFVQEAGAESVSATAGRYGGTKHVEEISIPNAQNHIAPTDGKLGRKTETKSSQNNSVQRGKSSIGNKDTQPVKSATQIEQEPVVKAQDAQDTKQVDTEAKIDGGVLKIDLNLKQQIETAKTQGYDSFVNTLESVKQTRPDLINQLVEENKQFIAESWLSILNKRQSLGRKGSNAIPFLQAVRTLDNLKPGIGVQIIESKLGSFSQKVDKILNDEPAQFLETIKTLDSLKPGLGAQIIESKLELFSKSLNRILGFFQKPNQFFEIVKTLDSLKPGLALQVIQVKLESFSESIANTLISNPNQFFEIVKTLDSLKPGLALQVIQVKLESFSESIANTLISNPNQFFEIVKTLDSLKPGLALQVIQVKLESFSESIANTLISNPNQFFEIVKTLDSLKPGLALQVINLKTLQFTRSFFKLSRSNNKDQTITEIKDIITRARPGIEDILSKLSELVDNRIPAVEAILDSAVDKAIETKNPVQTLGKIISIFELENVPNFVKRLMVFKYLYPPKLINQLQIDSPIYTKSKSETGNRVYNTAFRDLAKISINSGEPSTLKLAKLIQDIQKIDLEKISDSQDSILTNQKLENILVQLAILQSESLRGKRFERNKNPYNLDQFRQLSIPDKVVFLKKLIGNSQSGLIQEFENVYLKPLGIEKVSDIEGIYSQKVRVANARNIENSKNGLDEGQYLIKAVDSRNIESILNNGILSREFLGNSEVKSDLTPLDTDFIKSDGQLLSSDISVISNYGNLICGIKNRGQFNFDKQSDHKPYSQWSNEHEAFISGKIHERHVGVRTGIESLEIDFLILKYPSQNELDALAYNLAKKGLYIPIYNESKQLIFTPQDYQKSRKIFEGTQFNNQNINVQNDDLNLPPKYRKELLKIQQDRFDPQSQEKIIQHQNFIYKQVSSVINEQGIRVRNDNNFDIYGAEIIDTGSTGRGTSKADGVDFDFAVVLDATTFESKSAELLKSFNKAFQNLGGIDRIELNGNTLRLFGAKVGGDSIDIDISVMSKATADSFVSSDMAVKEKINNIASTYGNQISEQVKQQIVLAKTIMSKFNCYKKTYAGESEPSGIGGIGVENLILSSKGSFYEACKQILDIATVNGKQLSVWEFKEKYKLFDSGTNLRFIDGSFQKQHNNFIEALNEKGYENLLQMARDVVNS